MSILGSIAAVKKTGLECFHKDGNPLGFDVLSFWQWSSSNLLDNTMRGLLAEYLVARALDVDDGVRVEWDRVDLTAQNGLRIEVKSAAYMQSWAQTRPSGIRFDTAPKTGWYSATNTYDSQSRRAADVYIFCLLTHQDKETVDPLNLAQWRFLVISARTLDEQIGVQKSIGLLRLQAIGARDIGYGELARTVEHMSQS